MGEFQPLNKMLLLRLGRHASLQRPEGIGRSQGCTECSVSFADRVPREGWAALVAVSNRMAWCYPQRRTFPHVLARVLLGYPGSADLHSPLPPVSWHELGPGGSLLSTATPMCAQSQTRHCLPPSACLVPTDGRRTTQGLPFDERSGPVLFVASGGFATQKQMAEPLREGGPVEHLSVLLQELCVPRTALCRRHEQGSADCVSLEEAGHTITTLSLGPASCRGVARRPPIFTLKQPCLYNQPFGKCRWQRRCARAALWSPRPTTVSPSSSQTSLTSRISAPSWPPWR